MHQWPRFRRLHTSPSKSIKCQIFYHIFENFLLFPGRIITLSLFFRLPMLVNLGLILRLSWELPHKMTCCLPYLAPLMLRRGISPPNPLKTVHCVCIHSSPSGENSCRTYKDVSQGKVPGDWTSSLQGKYLLKIQFPILINILINLLPTGNNLSNFYSLKCINTKLTQIGEQFCGLDVNTPLGGELPKTQTPVLTFDALLTAVTATSTGDFKVAFIGTSEGHMKKAVVESASSGIKC